MNFPPGLRFPIRPLSPRVWNSFGSRELLLHGIQKGGVQGHTQDIGSRDQPWGRSVPGHTLVNIPRAYPGHVFPGHTQDKYTPRTNIPWPSQVKNTTGQIYPGPSQDKCTQAVPGQKHHRTNIPRTSPGQKNPGPSQDKYTQAVPGQKHHRTNIPRTSPGHLSRRYLQGPMPRTYLGHVSRETLEKGHFRQGCDP